MGTCGLWRQTTTARAGPGKLGLGGWLNEYPCLLAGRSFCGTKACAVSYIGFRACALLSITCRFDCVEILTASGEYGELTEEWASRLLYFIFYKELRFAVVRYFQRFQQLHPDLGVYVLREMDELQNLSFGVVSVHAISCHAHLIPDFDSLQFHPGTKKIGFPPNCDYFWDKPQDGRITSSAGAAVPRSVARPRARARARARPDHAAAGVDEEKNGL